MIATDEPFSPFTAFTQSIQPPATPSLQSLPHIPDVSSTLRREFRYATRSALLAATEEANSLTSDNDVSSVDECSQDSLTDFAYRFILVPHVAIGERGPLQFWAGLSYLDLEHHWGLGL